MRQSDLQELEQLHAELAEAQTEIDALADLVAELTAENKVLRGQLSILQAESTYEIA